MITQISVPTTVDLNSPVQGVLFSNTAQGAVSAVKSTSAVVTGVTVDNSANSQEAFVKMFPISSNDVTLGITPPAETVYALPGKIVTVTFSTQLPNGQTIPGKTFSNALSVACVNDFGGTEGTVPPVNPVQVTISYI